MRCDYRQPPRNLIHKFIATFWNILGTRVHRYIVTLLHQGLLHGYFVFVNYFVGFLGVAFHECFVGFVAGQKTSEWENLVFFS